MEKLEWKVIYAGSRQEKKLAERLQKLGVEVYLPLYKKLSQWSDRKKWVEWPLFSGYIFVRPSKQQRDLVLQQAGAIAYLSFQGKDAVVTEKELGIIQKMLNSGYTVEGISTPDDFEEGDQAWVLDGPLKGQKVDILRIDGKEVILVSFDTLGQSIKISLPAGVLKPV